MYLGSDGRWDCAEYSRNVQELLEWRLFRLALAEYRSEEATDAVWAHQLSAKQRSAGLVDVLRRWWRG